MSRTRTLGLVWLDSRGARVLRYAGDTVDHRGTMANSPAITTDGRQAG